MFEIGDEVDVVVLKYFPEDQKVSLGLKQKDQNPWELVEEKFSIGTKITGKIVSLTDYGAFIEIEPGVEGLIHVSEMSWTKKVRHPSKIVELGEMVEAIVKDLDVERKRISLSLKEVQANPWKLALDRYPVGCIVKGSIRNVTDFGIFVGLDEGIDGLVHVSDISWKQRQFKPADVASKGDDIEVKVLNIDVEQERLSLGIKQLTEDPWKNLDENNPLGTEITGTVVNLTDFGIFVEVSDGVEGLVHISEIDDSIQKNKIHEVYPVGTEVKTKVMKIDLEERRLGLSITEILSTPPPVVETPEEDSKAKADSAEEEKQSVSAEAALPETDKEEAEKESVTTDEIEDKVEAEAETPPVEGKEDAVEAEAAPSVEKTDVAAEKETAPKKEKEDAVEESLESKAKNDEDSSEKETIEKPESPESN
jgi:small subunit ribosomal protein S1